MQGVTGSAESYPGQRPYPEGPAVRDPVSEPVKRRPSSLLDVPVFTVTPVHNMSMTAATNTAISSSGIADSRAGPSCSMRRFLFEVKADMTRLFLAALAMEDNALETSDEEEEGLFTGAGNAVSEMQLVQHAKSATSTGSMES